MKVTGLTGSYLQQLSDDTSMFHGLCKTLSALDPTFKGKNFEYVPQDEDLFLELVNLNTIILVNEQDWILGVEGYPWYVASEDPSATLPAYWVGSTKSDEDGNTSQMTLQEWADSKNFTLQEFDDLGTTKYLIGNLGNKMNLFIASNLQLDGWELKEKSEAKEIYSSMDEV
jgi:hypothetical protein